MALATVLSQSTILTISFLVLKFKLKFTFPWKEIWHGKAAIFKPILRIAGPATFEPIAFQITQMIYAKFYIELGVTTMATKVYAFNIVIWVILWSLSLSTGSQVLIAELIGAKEYVKAHQRMIKSIKLGLLGSGVGMLILNIFAGSLFALFTKDTEIIELGCQLIIISIALELGRSLNLIVGGSLRAAGDSKYITVVSVAVLFGISVPLAWYLTLGTTLGLLGLWIAMSVDEWIRGIISVFRWNTGRWKTKGVT